MGSPSVFRTLYSTLSKSLWLPFDWCALQDERLLFRSPEPQRVLQRVFISLEFVTIFKNISMIFLRLFQAPQCVALLLNIFWIRYLVQVCENVKGIFTAQHSAAVESAAGRVWTSELPRTATVAALPAFWIYYPSRPVSLCLYTRHRKINAPNRNFLSRFMNQDW